jgi:SAM-dependent methyltransferase
MSTDQYSDGTYLAKVGDWHKGDSAWKATRVLDMISRNNLVLESVYDVGCGAGLVLAELAKGLGEHVQLAGFDISPQAIDMAKEYETDSLRFYNDDFLASDAMPADLVLLLDVFEHVPDYLGFLQSLAHQTDWVIFHIPLDMCGKAVVRKSDYMLEMRRQYGHLHYFSQETALATLRDSGFEIKDKFLTADEENGGLAVQRKVIHKIYYLARRGLIRVAPELAAACFTHFNLMVLARGERRR